MDNIPSPAAEVQVTPPDKSIDVLIKDMLLAFGDKNYELTRQLADQVNVLSPDNPEAKKVLIKLEKAIAEKAKNDKNFTCFISIYNL